MMDDCVMIVFFLVLVVIAIIGWVYETTKRNKAESMYMEVWTAARGLVSVIPEKSVCLECSVVNGHHNDCQYNLALRNLRCVLDKRLDL